MTQKLGNVNIRMSVQTEECKWVITHPSVAVQFLQSATLHFATILPHRSNKNTKYIEHGDLKMQDLYAKSHAYNQLPDTAT